MSDERDLEQVRADIDAIDREVQQLLNRRAACAQRVADIKIAEAQANGQASDDVVFYRPEREAQVLERIMARNEGPLEGPTVAHIFREIMSACLALERPLHVAYLGPEGTFTQAAAIKHFGHAAICVPRGNIDEVFAQVESGKCNYGVVPVENSTEGMVNHTLDNLMDSTVKISGEVELRIEHHLLASEKSSAEQIVRICAHQQALAQCRNWLDKHWPNAEREAVSSNGEAAQKAAQDPRVAAIAGDMAAELYNLQHIASHIEDRQDNTTRFLVVGREEVPPSGRDKTAIIVSSHNRSGALFHLLEPFQRSEISLTRIEARPSRVEKWAYVFFIEFEGHRQDDKVAAILGELEEQSIMLKTLGSFPRAVL